MTVEYFIAWFLLMFPIIVTPGPANIVFAAAGVKQGFTKSLPMLIGIDLIILMYAALFGFGLGAFMQSQPILLQVLKYVGVAYMLYLSYKLLKASRMTKIEDGKSVYTFVSGILISLTNVKVITSHIMMYSIFLDGSFDVTQQVIYLCIMVSITNVLVHMFWLWGGASVAKLFNKRPKLEEGLNVFFALTLAMVAIWMLF